MSTAGVELKKPPQGETVKYGDITALYDLFEQYELIRLLNRLIPERGLLVGEVFVSLAIIGYLAYLVLQQTTNPKADSSFP